jgi:hypothetical protein
MKFLSPPALPFFRYKPDHEHDYEPHPGWVYVTDGTEPGSTGTARPLDAERCAICGEIQWGSFSGPAQSVTVVV